MNDLLKIVQTQIGVENVNSINARDIHNYLEVKTTFANWIKRAIEKYDFIQNEDYITFITDAKSGKRDYIVSLDMAKELCMLENNQKGKATRKYFISVEKQSQKIITTADKIVLLAQGHQEIDSRVSEVEKKINYLENKAPISYTQVKILEDKRKAIVYKLVGYNPQDPASKANYTKTLRSLTKKFKNHFSVARYADIPQDLYDDGLAWLDDVKLVDLIQ